MKAYIRHPAVAGTFYSSDPAQLENTVREMLLENKKQLPPPKALIVPHAGHIYSGPIAASAYSLLEPLKGEIQRVILIGPAHRYGFMGIALSGATCFETPLGRLAVDHKSEALISDLPFVHTLPEAHSLEHSLEVHLPFLQDVLGDFEIVPLVAGSTTPQQIQIILEKLWGGPETLIVISSDLSHYLPYEQGQQIDQETSKMILSLSNAQLNGDRACGYLPIAGLLNVAREKKLQAKLVDLRNSGDTAGDKREVVGYGAYVFYE